MRLIDADHVLNALGIFNDREHGNEHFLNGIETAREIIENAPTIDAVPVVRCKDCRWWDTGDDKYHYCFCHITLRYVPGDLYCADGERRGGNEAD